MRLWRGGKKSGSRYQPSIGSGVRDRVESTLSERLFLMQLAYTSFSCSAQSPLLDVYARRLLVMLYTGLLPVLSL